MASVAIMVGGAVLNAVAFIGGNYLARVLSGDDSKASIEENVRHDKALEAYQAAYAKYEKERTKLFDWIETQHDIKERPSKTLRIPTTLSRFITRSTNMTNSPCRVNQSFLAFTSPTGDKNKVSYFLLAPALLLLDMPPFDFYKFIIYGECQAFKHLLYPSRVLERSFCCIKARRSGQGL